MLALVSVESRVPRNHALRSIKPLVDEVLRGLSPTFDEMYSGVGRPSVPPERLPERYRPHRGPLGRFPGYPACHQACLPHRYNGTKV